MTEQEMDAFLVVLEIHLTSHLKPVDLGVDRWGKAMSVIKRSISILLEREREREANRNRAAVEMAYSHGYQAGQGLKG